MYDLKTHAMIVMHDMHDHCRSFLTIHSFAARGQFQIEFGNYRLRQGLDLIFLLRRRSRRLVVSRFIGYDGV
jgi:hypothetical protein